MWENLVRRIRPGRPQPESANVHAPHAPDPGHGGRGVEMEGGAPGGRSYPEAVARRRGSASSEAEDALPRYGRDEGRRLRCPNCGAAMRYELLGSIEIDRCPDCGGVFLDRGELAELAGDARSSYLPADAAPRESQSVLIYTPHGLSDHVRESEHEHHGGESDVPPERYNREA